MDQILDSIDVSSHVLRTREYMQFVVSIQRDRSLIADDLHNETLLGGDHRPLFETPRFKRETIHFGSRRLAYVKEKQHVDLGGHGHEQ